MKSSLSLISRLFAMLYRVIWNTLNSYVRLFKVKLNCSEIIISILSLQFINDNLFEQSLVFFLVTFILYFLNNFAEESVFFFFKKNYSRFTKSVYSRFLFIFFCYRISCIYFKIRFPIKNSLTHEKSIGKHLRQTKTHVFDATFQSV